MQKEKIMQIGYTKPHIGYFVSPHGFGHAARAAGAMAALHEINPSIHFEIFTKVPQWFFEQSLSSSFTYHSYLTDIGLVQKTPLHEDLPKTLQCLNEFLPFNHLQITSLVKLVKRLKCQLIICDIAPMGIVVAEAADVPSVLIENFTWDWIYQGYTHNDYQLNKHIDYLHKIFESVDYYIQTEPVCRYRTADLTTFPICRKARTSPQQIRQKLGIPDNAKMVLITMGGIPEQYSFLNQLTHQRNVYFVIPGSSQSRQLRDNLALLPHHSDFFHPDLINACDAVVGKLGYSTLAETFHAGVPFGYVTRTHFRESKILENFITKHMNGYAITEMQFQDGSWISLLPDLLELPRIERSNSNGATQVARFIHNVLDRKFKG
jgi:uncharacterized protein (TIGR00661 family)